MKPRFVENPGSPHPALDPYRRGVARAFEDGVEVGFLWSRVGWMWTVVGPFWARRHVSPEEHMEWFLEFHEPPAGDRMPFTEGFYDGGEMLEDFRRAKVNMNGHTYDLRWLHGAESAAVPAPDGFWDEHF